MLLAVASPEEARLVEDDFRTRGWSVVNDPSAATLLEGGTFDLVYTDDLASLTVFDLLLHPEDQGGAPLVALVGSDEAEREAWSGGADHVVRRPLKSQDTMDVEGFLRELP